MVPDGEERPAVQQRLVHGEVEAGLAWLERRPVEWALAAVEQGATTLRALVRGPVRALLVEQELDARVGGSVERLRPARRGARALGRALAPALDRGPLVGDTSLFEQRRNDAEQPVPIGVRLGLDRADDRVLDLVRKRRR